MNSKRKSRRRFRPRRTESAPASAISRGGEPAAENFPGEGSSPEMPAPLTARQWIVKAVAAAALLVVFAWAYWPTLQRLVSAWETEPDYSHGYLVVPLAIAFLFVRRHAFPGFAAGLSWMGLLPIALAGVMRVGSEAVYVEALDGWSIPVWVAGGVWLLGGGQALLWALPSVGFLLFMVPLPYGAEHGLSQPLQAMATKLSCFGLQILGQPALSEGNTIWLGDIQMQVEEACSGLRIFVGIVALAYATVVLVDRPWWTKGLLLAATLPVALAANSTRVVVTGLLWRNISGEVAHQFSHDLAGWTMIPLAAALFAFSAWYLGKLFPRCVSLDVGSAWKSESERQSTSSATTAPVEKARRF